MAFSPDLIFYWTGWVLWALGCTCVVICVLAFVVIVPAVLAKRTINTLWTWIVCAKLRKYDLTQQDVFDAYQDAYNMSDIGKLLTKDEERETVLKFIRIFTSEMEGRVKKKELQ